MFRKITKKRFRKKQPAQQQKRQPGMPAFRSIHLWYLIVFLFALHATGCAASGADKVVKHPIPHLYGMEDPQFSRTMGTLLGMGILEGNQVDVLLNGEFCPYICHKRRIEMLPLRETAALASMNGTSVFSVSNEPFWLIVLDGRVI